jgi:Asp-tRNA(Asn)/Glu-tRNA(Gln) amidotransferase A subunit family amidase
MKMTSDSLETVEKAIKKIAKINGKHHLPVGLQMIGRYMEDETVLKFADNYEKLHPYLK